MRTSLILLTLGFCNALVGPTIQTRRSPTLFARDVVEDYSRASLGEEKWNHHRHLAVANIGAVSALLAPAAANAAGPDWGLFEGKTGSLLHPVSMAGLLIFSLITGFKGFQWRRMRGLGEEITALKKQIPTVNVEEGETLPASALAIQKQVDELTAERKDLAGKNLRDDHFQSGVVLAAAGTFFAIEGPLNTYARAGKLFPGPHLYAGAGLVVLWSVAAAMVPFMQKGNDTARSIHIALNAVGTGLFGWQVVSGFPILLKVWEKTQWP